MNEIEDNSSEQVVNWDQVNPNPLDGLVCSYEPAENTVFLLRVDEDLNSETFCVDVEDADLHEQLRKLDPKATEPISIWSHGPEESGKRRMTVILDRAPCDMESAARIDKAFPRCCRWDEVPACLLTR